MPQKEWTNIEKRKEYSRYRVLSVGYLGGIVPRLTHCTSVTGLMASIAWYMGSVEG